MKNFKVKVTNGYYDAPTLTVEAKNEKEASEIARKRSGLGRFSECNFIAY